MLLWTVMCKFLCGHVISVLSDAPVRVELLGRVVTVFNIVLLLLFSCSVVSDSLQPCGLRQARLPCPSPYPRACLNSDVLGQLCHPTISSSAAPFFFLPSIFPSIRGFSNESALHIRWPKYWSFNFNNSLSNEYSRLISFRIDWFAFLAVQGTLKNCYRNTKYPAPNKIKITVSDIQIIQLKILRHTFKEAGKQNP